MPEGEVVTRTVRANVVNHAQLQDDLDPHGFGASKLWNVGLWTIHRVWNGTGDHIPDDGELSAYLKNHERYRDLPAQSSQRVLQELSEAFRSWYQQDSPDHNPPGYRKRGDEHPRSTVTWKDSGFRVDTKHQQSRLSKGRNHKESRNARDYILCEYETRPDVDRTRIDAPEQPGERTAGVDLGITNFAAVSIGAETVLYPGNALKEDAHHFRQIEYETEGEDGPSNRAEWARRKKARRQHHFLHATTRDIADLLVRWDVGEVAIGHPKHIRSDNDWGRHGNKRLHDWPFADALDLLEYKLEERGIEVERTDEAKLKTSKTCCCCGRKASGNRVERGLYVCDGCRLTANADVNAAENMRLTVTPSLAPGDRGWDRSNGCLAQPAVRLFDKSTGRVAGREQVADCRP